MTFYLSRLYCDTCHTRGAFKLHECGACFHDTCNKNHDQLLNIHVCPDCKGPARFASLIPEQVIIFQDACSAEGDVLEVLLRTQLIRNRRSAEACLNYIWDKTDHRYPVMLMILQNIIENLERLDL